MFYKYDHVTMAHKHYLLMKLLNPRLNETLIMS